MSDDHQLDLLRDQLTPNDGDWLRALELAEANANRDRQGVADVLAAAVEAGDQPRLVGLIVAYLAVLPPPRLGLVKALRMRTESAAFDNIVADFGDQIGDNQ
ncbi:hypothetical protein [Gordonia malaquae]|uniref:hypothetical protein n=1 Tax=Gordonia malaquae TaxID=410332 RepID=UPI0030FE59F0